MTGEKRDRQKQAKQILRWAIWGAALFFIVHTLISYWPEIRQLALRANGGKWLALGCAMTLVAHCWAGWVWHWLLQDWGLRLGGLWAVRVYLLTNVAKYLPGNVWHFVGRVRAVQNAGGALGQSVVSVVAEPLVMAVAALGMGVVFGWLGWILSVMGFGLDGASNVSAMGLWWCLGLSVGWAIALYLLHPDRLNPRLQQMSRLRLRSLTEEPPKEESVLKLERYPVRPLLGEMGFVLGRSLGFVAVVMALTPVSLTDCPVLISAFCLAWLLGLVVPGAPGGVGIFEATATALLSGHLPIGVIVGSVVCYRMMGTLAELMGAVVFWVQAKFWAAS